MVLHAEVDERPVERNVERYFRPKLVVLGHLHDFCIPEFSERKSDSRLILTALRCSYSGCKESIPMDYCRVA